MFFLNYWTMSVLLVKYVQQLSKVLRKDFHSSLKSLQQSELVQKSRYTAMQIVWTHLITLVFLHLGAFIGLCLVFTEAQWQTTLWAVLISEISQLGVILGVHRLWSHRSYKAKLPLRIILAICQTISLQNNIYRWALNHRLHHKFEDTNADPHNSKRGVFFSHMGWLLVKKHEHYLAKAKTIDMSDILADPVVRFQMKFFPILATVLTLTVSIWVPWYFWSEDLLVAFFVSFILRYVVSLHISWMLNSFAHVFGNRPFDKNVSATDHKLLCIISTGESWHNYHHVFPWDYKTADFGSFSINMNSTLIELMAKIGWAYDLRTVSKELVLKRMERTGDSAFFDKPY